MDQMTVRMPERLRDAAEAAAEKQGYADLSEFVRDAVREKTPRAELDRNGSPDHTGNQDG